MTYRLKLFSQMYFLFASFYCFLALVPFTYLFVIVNPPYEWLISFAHYNLIFLWLGLATSVAYSCLQPQTLRYRIVLAIELLLAVMASLKNPIAHLHNDVSALVWSLAFLAPPLLNSIYEISCEATRSEPCLYSCIAYSDGAIIGFVAGFASIATSRVHNAIYVMLLPLGRGDVEIMFWVLIEHVTFAIAVVSVINLTRLVLHRFTHNSLVIGPGVFGSWIFLLMLLGLSVFIEESLSFRGWIAWIYSLLFSAAVTLFCLRAWSPSAPGQKATIRTRWLERSFEGLVVVSTLCVLVIIDPRDDWNGILHKTATLLLWIVCAVGIWRSRSVTKHYSVTTMLVVTFLTFGAYKMLRESKSVWAADVGADATQTNAQLKNYADRNASFGLVDTILGNQPSELCDTDCRIFRQYSNVRSPALVHDLKLVDHLTRTAGPRPNIFIIVIDSLRADYLGAYNSRVNFTPNIDAFARDSIVMRRTYSNYAGTSLSEPAIWSGALLLHAHYPQPFQKLNSLEKLARVDGYQILLTYDVVLRSIIPDESDLVKFDKDKQVWQEVEFSDTLHQLESFLDNRKSSAPVFFYTQPMNIQVHSENHLPKRTGENWQHQDGFEDRIAFALHQTDEFFGSFVAYLKARGLYDNSIVIITADHGDATGELGRSSHSYVLYPEVMRVPLIFHLPSFMRGQYIYDEKRITSLVDIAPSLYYLLGHRPIQMNPLFGRPIFMASQKEFAGYPARDELFLASDCCATYGILAGDGRWLFTAYDSPSHSMLFDLANDPNAQHNVLTPVLKRQYDDRILAYLRMISSFYGHKPTGL